jgi:methanogenic corrinoid protein MtbC1
MDSRGGWHVGDAPTRLFEAFVARDPARAISVIQDAADSGMSHLQLFDQVYAPALSLLGGAWADGSVDEYAFTEASVVAEQITSFVTPATATATTDASLSIAVLTLAGDRHTIDKNIVSAALKEAGYRVFDLGSGLRATEAISGIERTAATVLIVFTHSAGATESVHELGAMLRSSGHEDVAMFVSGGSFAADVDLAKAAGANGIVRGAESALGLVAQVCEMRARDQ